MDQTAIGKVEAGFARADLIVSPADGEILRPVAERVAKIASSAAMAEKRKLWKDHNALKKGRPLVFCDPEMGWNEVVTEDQMQCQGKLARAWEMDLRKEIFWAEEMKDDKPLDPFFEIPYSVTPDDWGLKETQIKTSRWDRSGGRRRSGIMKRICPRFIRPN